MRHTHTHTHAHIIKTSLGRTHTVTRKRHVHVAQRFFIKPTKEKLEINTQQGQKNLLSDKQKRREHQLRVSA